MGPRTVLNVLPLLLGTGAPNAPFAQSLYLPLRLY